MYTEQHPQERSTTVVVSRSTVPDAESKNQDSLGGASHTPVLNISEDFPHDSDTSCIQQLDKVLIPPSSVLKSQSPAPVANEYEGMNYKKSSKEQYTDAEWAAWHKQDEGWKSKAEIQEERKNKRVEAMNERDDARKTSSNCQQRRFAEMKESSAPSPELKSKETPVSKSMQKRAQRKRRIEKNNGGA